jgi:hypothetical protein
MRAGLLQQPVKRLGGSTLPSTPRSCRWLQAASSRCTGTNLPSQLQWVAAGSTAQGPLPSARRCRLWRAATASEGSPSGSNSENEEQNKPGLLSNILKPLRDFGIGRTSLVQGGVGLFVFSGIGVAPLSLHDVLIVRCAVDDRSISRLSFMQALLSCW